MMAQYIAEKILLGQQSYAKIFGFKMYKRYQEDVNCILVAEGREDLIVEV